MDILDCMTAREITSVTTDDEHQSILSEYVLHDWQSMTTEKQNDLQLHWSFGCGIATIDRITMIVKRIIVSASLPGEVMNRLHINNMGIEETRLLASKSIYWIHMKPHIEDTDKNCPTCLNLQATQPQDKTVSYQITGRPW